MSENDVQEKFRRNASLALADGELERLEYAVLAIEEHDDLRAAFAPLAARPRVKA